MESGVNNDAFYLRAVKDWLQALADSLYEDDNVNGSPMQIHTNALWVVHNFDRALMQDAGHRRNILLKLMFPPGTPVDMRDFDKRFPLQNWENETLEGREWVVKWHMIATTWEGQPIDLDREMIQAWPQINMQSQLGEWTRRPFANRHVYQNQTLLGGGGPPPRPPPGGGVIRNTQRPVALQRPQGLATQVVEGMLHPMQTVAAFWTLLAYLVQERGNQYSGFH